MVGCILSRRKGRGPLVRGGDKTSNQCTRTKRTTICNSILHSKHETLEQHRHSNGQHGRSFLSNEDWATNNQVLVGLSKQIWNYLMSKRIILTAEDLPGILNVEADFESRNVKDSNEWMLKRELFQKFAQT